MSTKPRAGDEYRLDLVSTADGKLAKNVTVTIERVRPLSCGCIRLETKRPGPADGPLAGSMHLHVQRCTYHAANSPDGTGIEPHRVELTEAAG